MKKHLFILTLAAACALQSAAELRCLYYSGSFNYHMKPWVGNAERFEKFKLMETAEGSNVYSGIISSVYSADYFTEDWFSLYTALADEEDDCSYKNLLMPAQQIYDTFFWLIIILYFIAIAIKLPA